MAAEVKINAPFVQEESTNEEFHDANTEHLQKSSNLDDFQLTDGDLAVQTEPVRKESSQHVSAETAVELATVRDRNTAETVALASNPPQEDVKCERGEVLGGDADTENKLAEQQFLEEGREEDEEAVVEDASNDSSESETAEEEGNSLTLENEPTERDAVGDSEQKEGSDFGDSGSTEEELAYEAKTDSSHSGEEESDQDKYDKEDEAEEEEEGEQDKCDEEDEAKGEEEEGEQDKCDEEDEAKGEEEEGEQDKCNKEDKAEGDGWEEPAEGADFDTDEKEKKTEKPKDPSVVPRDNRYFLHDMREGEEIGEDDQDEQDTQVAEEEPKTEADRVVRWEHDLFVREEQGPRSEEEKKKDAWRFDDTQGGRGRGRGRGFRQGRGRRFGYQGQGYDRDQRYDSQDQRREGRDQRYDSRDSRYDSQDRRRDNQNQRYDGRYQSRDGQDQRFGRDQRRDDRYQRRDDQYQGYGRDQRHNGQRRGGYHRQDRQRSEDDGAGSWDDKSNHQQQQKRPDDQEDGFSYVATGQEYDGKKDHRQDGRPSYSRGSFIKGGNFHRGGFATRSERNHGGDSWEEEKKAEEGGELNQAAVTVGKRPEGAAMVGKRPEGEVMTGKRPEGEAMAGKRPEGEAMTGKRPEGAAMVGKRPQGEAMVRKRPEGAAMVGKRPGGKAMVGKRPEGEAMVGKRPEGVATVRKGTEDANDLPQISKKSPWNDSSSHQMSEGHKVSPKGDRQEQPAQQSEELLPQSKAVQQKSLFGKGTSQDTKPGKERRPARLYSLARGRPTSGVGGSGTKPGAAPEEGSMTDTGKGHGSNSQPRSNKVPGSAHPVRTEHSEETISNDPPVEGEGEGEKGGGPKRYSIQRGSGEGGAGQKPVQGYPVFFMPGDQYAQTTLSSSNEPNSQGSPQHSSGGGKRPKTQTAKGQQKALLATPAETAPYGVPFIPGPGPPGVGGPVLQYMQPVEGMPPLAMAVDPAMMMGNWEELGHFHGGLFIPHVHPEGQRMMMPVPGDSPQHVQPTPHQPKQRSRAIPIVAPQTTQEGEQALDTMESIS